MTEEVKNVLVIVVPVLIALVYAFWKRESIAAVIGKFLGDKVAVGVVRAFLIKKLGGDEAAKILADRLVGLSDFVEEFTPDEVDAVLEAAEEVVVDLLGKKVE